MATAAVVADGLYFGEGPRWHDGRLWFSDFYDHAVKTYTLDGRIETVFTIEGQTSGLGWLPNGDLLAVSMIDQALLRWRAGAPPEPYASLAGVATFHCNDMVVDAAGRAYVGNFGFDLDGFTDVHGFAAILDDPDALMTNLALVHPDGSVTVAASGMLFPNGTVLTSDGRTLIVAESIALRLTAFDVADDGTLSNRRVWAPLDAHLITPDGIAIDAEGAVWVANALGHDVVRVAEGGEVLERVATSQHCYACALGGPDGTTLFACSAPTSHRTRAAASRSGRIEIAEVDVPAPAGAS